jgi:hypothetical protein
MRLSRKLSKKGKRFREFQMCGREFGFAVMTVWTIGRPLWFKVSLFAVSYCGAYSLLAKGLLSAHGIRSRPVARPIA